MVQVKEFELKLPGNGLTIRGQRWGREGKAKVLCLHGWLDNSASFQPMMPYIDDMEMIAIDLPGHGKSDHFPGSQAYQMFDYVKSVFALTEALGWKRFNLLSHSLGACISVLMAGAFPERVLAMTLIEGLGPMSYPDKECPDRYRKHILSCEKRGRSGSPAYADQLQAARSRSEQSNVDLPSALLLAERGTRPSGGEAGIVWRTDPALRFQSPHPLTELQLYAFLDRISCKSRLILADDGWPFDKELMEKRVERVKDLELLWHKGSHHLHMEYPREIAGLILNNTVFLDD